VESGKPRVGDRVKLTIEGEVNYVESSGFTVREAPEPPNGNGVFFRYDNASLKNVVIIARKWQIGDMIDRNDIMPWEPAVGTLIRNVSLGRHYMKLLSTGRWVDSNGVFAQPSAMPGGTYQIMMLGGEQVTIS
jgi:hypothetical protein